jgi:hypothetical protein
MPSLSNNFVPPSSDRSMTAGDFSNKNVSQDKKYDY